MRKIQQTPQARKFLEDLKKKGKRNHGIAIINRYKLLASLQREYIINFPTVVKLNDQPLVISFKIDYRELDDLCYWEEYIVVCLIEKIRFVIVSISYGEI